MKIVILAAGIGSRLGYPSPKPLTMLSNGQSIMERQMKNISSYFNFHDINVIVGFKKDLIMEKFPDVSYIYNQFFDQTNTSKSLLMALQKHAHESVLWMNGDVVFDERIFDILLPYIEADQSFVSVNNQEVGEEEVKYTLDESGYIKDISKQVEHGLGEAVGINFISKVDIGVLVKKLEACDANAYFEKGIEEAINHDAIKVKAVDISKYDCLEIDFVEDLEQANRLF
jgi:choline kinase